uniref:Ribosomal protein L20 n=1 Tax=Mastocarpus papillatus TaxID=31436 RepID=A0A342RZ81_9FLOR|nr:ribosomal protein L20 [Mastocarpus papillatus]AOL58027.1 ribosomal protein L20 [Mastocarpus papillatus]
MLRKLKKEITCTKSRKLKKKVFHQNFVKRLGSPTNSKLNLTTYFNSKEKIYLNRKLLSSLFITEGGFLFSWKKWTNSFFSRFIEWGS